MRQWRRSDPADSHSWRARQSWFPSSLTAHRRRPTVIADPRRIQRRIFRSALAHRWKTSNWLVLRRREIDRRSIVKPEQPQLLWAAKGQDEMQGALAFGKQLHGLRRLRNDPSGTAKGLERPHVGGDDAHRQIRELVQR